MPMTWNAEAFKQLFANYLVIHDVGKVDYNALAASMGPECTAKALTHKFAELKRLGAAAASSRVAAPATPKPKRKSNAGITKSGKGATAKKQKKNYSADTESDDEEDLKDIVKKSESDDEEGPASKRIKTDEDVEI